MKIFLKNLPMQKLFFFLIVGIVISLILPDPAGSQSPILPKNEFYPGDALAMEFIDVYKQKERSSINIGGEYSIDSRGYIMLPLIGPFKVVGYNRYSLAEKLVEAYKEFFTEPYISITPLIRVTISGPFYRPGAYRVSPQASLWEVIERAGGPRDNCDLTSIKVIRNDKVVIEDLLASFEKGYSLEDIGIQSGDQIAADEKSKITMRQVLDYLRFGLSLLSLYILILRWENVNK